MANMHPDTSGLIPFNQLSNAERTEIATKGGIASGKARQEQLKIENIARKILAAQVTDVADYDYGAVPVEESTVAELMMAVHANKALKGDKESARLVLDSAKGENKKLPLGGFQFVIESGDDEI